MYQYSTSLLLLILLVLTIVSLVLVNKSLAYKDIKNATDCQAKNVSLQTQGKKKCALWDNNRCFKASIDSSNNCVKKASITGVLLLVLSVVLFVALIWSLWKAKEQPHMAFW